VVNLDRREVVNFNRRNLVSLNQREVVNFTGVCNKHLIKTFIDAFLTKRQIQQLAS
jgi:hypothetical protein